MIREVDPSLVQHSEYDIEVSDTDGTELENANKLVIIPVLEHSEIELRRNKETLLSIPIKNIEKVIQISNPVENLRKDKELVLRVTFNDFI